MVDEEAAQGSQWQWDAFDKYVMNDADTKRHFPANPDSYYIMPVGHGEATTKDYTRFKYLPRFALQEFCFSKSQMVDFVWEFVEMFEKWTEEKADNLLHGKRKNIRPTAELKELYTMYTTLLKGKEGEQNKELDKLVMEDLPKKVEEIYERWSDHAKWALQNRVRRWITKGDNIDTDRRALRQKVNDDELNECQRRLIFLRIAYGPWLILQSGMVFVDIPGFDSDPRHRRIIQYALRLEQSPVVIGLFKQDIKSDCQDFRDALRVHGILDNVHENRQTLIMLRYDERNERGDERSQCRIARQCNVNARQELTELISRQITDISEEDSALTAARVPIFPARPVLFASMINTLKVPSHAATQQVSSSGTLGLAMDPWLQDQEWVKHMDFTNIPKLIDILENKIVSRVRPIWKELHSSLQRASQEEAHSLNTYTGRQVSMREAQELLSRNFLQLLNNEQLKEGINQVMEDNTTKLKEKCEGEAEELKKVLEQWKLDCRKQIEEFVDNNNIKQHPRSIISFLQGRGMAEVKGHREEGAGGAKTKWTLVDVLTDKMPSNRFNEMFIEPIKKRHSTMFQECTQDCLHQLTTAAEAAGMQGGNDTSEIVKDGFTEYLQSERRRKEYDAWVAAGFKLDINEVFIRRCKDVKEYLRNVARKLDEEDRHGAQRKTNNQERRKSHKNELLTAVEKVTNDIANGMQNYLTKLEGRVRQQVVGRVDRTFNPEWACEHVLTDLQSILTRGHKEAKSALQKKLQIDKLLKRANALRDPFPDFAHTNALMEYLARNSALCDTERKWNNIRPRTSCLESPAQQQVPVLGCSLLRKQSDRPPSTEARLLLESLGKWKEATEDGKTIQSIVQQLVSDNDVDVDVDAMRRNIEEAIDHHLQNFTPPSMVLKSLEMAEQLGGGRDTAQLIILMQHWCVIMQQNLLLQRTNEGQVPCLLILGDPCHEEEIRHHTPSNWFLGAARGTGPLDLLLPTGSISHAVSASSSAATIPPSQPPPAAPMPVLHRGAESSRQDTQASKRQKTQSDDLIFTEYHTFKVPLPRHGEDACAAYLDFLAVFDGVGEGGNFSREKANALSEACLRQLTQTQTQTDAGSQVDRDSRQPGNRSCAALRGAIEACKVERPPTDGSTTALIASLVGCSLHISSLGDCQVAVLTGRQDGARCDYVSPDGYFMDTNGQLKRTNRGVPYPVQTYLHGTHQFDCKYGEHEYRGSDGIHEAQIDLEDGSIVIAGTDGFWDNLRVVASSRHCNYKNEKKIREYLEERFKKVLKEEGRLRDTCVNLCQKVYNDMYTGETLGHWSRKPDDLTFCVGRVRRKPPKFTDPDTLKNAYRRRQFGLEDIVVKGEAAEWIETYLFEEDT
uniref:PPM-type phosphatase domain-containing protein n=1 Tax=Eutreptiella gymnastica TaxID=73025 RepID=A0A7S1I112_9EUGL